MFELIIWRSKW